jgi:PHD/YefM family antitoxin component YafN of YafNO toxin-antitoxin module
MREDQRKGRKVKRSRERFVLDNAGRKNAVVLSIGEYETLLEDLHDLAVIAERLREEPINIEEM